VDGVKKHSGKLIETAESDGARPAPRRKAAIPMDDEPAYGEAQGFSLYDVLPYGRQPFCTSHGQFAIPGGMRWWMYA